MSEDFRKNCITLFPHSGNIVALSWTFSLAFILLSALFLTTKLLEPWQVPFFGFAAVLSIFIIAICVHQLRSDFLQSRKCAATLSAYLQAELSRLLRERIGYQSAVFSVIRWSCGKLAWRSCILYFGPLLCLAVGAVMIQRKILLGFYPDELPAVAWLSFPLWAMTGVTLCISVFLYAAIVPNYLILIHAWGTSALMQLERDSVTQNQIGSEASESETQNRASHVFASGMPVPASSHDHSESQVEPGDEQHPTSSAEAVLPETDSSTYSGRGQREKMSQNSDDDDLFIWDD